MRSSKLDAAARDAGLSRWAVAAVFTLSAAIIALQLALMRCLSVASWHHFSYLVISTALLGFGASGTLLSLFGRRMLKAFGPWSWILTLLFATSVTLCFRTAQALPLNVRYVLFSRTEAAWMLAYHMLLFVPFLLGATVIGLSLMRLGARVHLVYGANLLGSGAGAAGIVGFMFLMPPQELMHVVAALAMAAAAFWMLSAGAGRKKARIARQAALWVGCAVLLVAQGALWPLRLSVDQYKMLSTLRRWQQDSNATHLIVRNGPRARLDVFESPSLHQTLFAGLTATEEPPPQLMVLADGHPAGTVFRIESARQAAILDHTPMSVPYRLLDRPRVLLLGESGGVNVWLALRFGAAHVTVVQRNPQIVELMRGPLAAPSGGILLKPQVSVVRSEPRLFLERTGGRYDIIQLVSAEEMTAGSSGLRSLHEDFLLTREGLALCLEHLSERGLLSVTRGTQAPPRDAIKLFASLAESLESLGIEKPGDHLVLFRNYLAATILASHSPLQKPVCRQLERICRRMMLDLEWCPYETERDSEQFNKVPGPPGQPHSYFRHAAQKILSPQREAFYREWFYNIRPASDDAPYFYNFFRWRSLPRFLELYGAHWLRRLELGYAVLVLALGEVVVVGGLMILLPLLWLKKAFRRPTVARRLPIAAYFACLGLAFMTVEMVCILEFNWFLGDPIYSVAVIVAAFLVFSGFGSAMSGRVHLSPGRAIALAGLALAVLLTFYSLGLRGVLARFVHLGTPARLCLSIALVAPAAFLMGWPFPTGLTMVRASAPAFVPWAWGVNGFASVAASPMAVLLAISFGYTRVLFLAAALYLTASIIGLALPKGGDP